MAAMMKSIDGVDIPMTAEEIAAFDAMRVPGKAELKGLAARLRWERETGGLTLPSGLKVLTDDIAQRKIGELRRRVEAGEIPVPFGFKSRAGWHDLTKAQIVALDKAVANHVNALYAREREIDAAIEGGTITTGAQVEAAFAV